MQAETAQEVRSTDSRCTAERPRRLRLPFVRHTRDQSFAALTCTRAVTFLALALASTVSSAALIDDPPTLIGQHLILKDCLFCTPVDPISFVVTEGAGPEVVADGWTLDVEAISLRFDFTKDVNFGVPTPFNFWLSSFNHQLASASTQPSESTANGSASIYFNDELQLYFPGLANGPNGLRGQFAGDFQQLNFVLASSAIPEPSVLFLSLLFLSAFAYRLSPLFTHPV